MQKFRETALTIRNGQVRVLPGASVSVYLADTNTLAQLYANRAGTIDLRNPFEVTDTGVVEFHAADGLYDVLIEKNGFDTVRLPSVSLLEGLLSVGELKGARFGNEAAVPYVAGIPILRSTQAVEYQGRIYEPKPGELDFVTSGTFEAAKFREVRGATSVDLELDDGGDEETFSSAQEFVASRVRCGTYAKARRSTTSAKKIEVIGTGVEGSFLADTVDIDSGAYFTGSLDSATLTVSAVANGTLRVGQAINRGDTGETVGYIESFGTGNGGTGTYTLTAAAIISSMTMSADDADTYLVRTSDGRRMKRAMRLARHVSVGSGDNAQAVANRCKQRSLQVLMANLRLQNNVLGGVNICGDSIGHGAYSGNAYTNHWTYLLARAVNAQFGGRSIGVFPLEHVYNSVSSLNTKQLIDTTFSAGWGSTSANPSPYNYPLGDFGPSSGGLGAGSVDIINGKAYSSTTSGSTITLTFSPIAERLIVYYTQKPGGGVLNITRNGSSAGTINTAGTLAYNQTAAIAVEDNGKGECTVVLTKADGNSTQVNACAGLLSAEIGITALDTRLHVKNFSQSGRSLGYMSEAAIIAACNAPCLIMALGYNDQTPSGGNTDANDANFAAFKQRIDWFIKYAKVYRALVIVPDFIWYAAPTSRTRQQLRRLAAETGGVYLPFADWFYSDAIPPVGSVLNDPGYLWADVAHPGPIPNAVIFSMIAEAMGLSVTSKQQALKYHDWPFPITISHADFTNTSPTFIRTLSTIQRDGDAYRLSLNISHTASLPSTDMPTGTLWALNSSIPTKFNNGVALGVADESTTFAINSATGAIIGLLTTDSSCVIRAKALGAFVGPTIKKTVVLQGGHV